MRKTMGGNEGKGVNQKKYIKEKRQSSHAFALSMVPWASQVALVVKNLSANSGDIRDMG